MHNKSGSQAAQSSPPSGELEGALKFKVQSHTDGTDDTDFYIKKKQITTNYHKFFLFIITSCFLLLPPPSATLQRASHDRWFIMHNA